MSTDRADNHLIEKYLLGKLSDKEISGFHARLAEDREFSRKFRLIKTFPEMMSEEGRAELDKKLTDAVDRVVAERTSRFSRKHYLAWGAVSVAVVAGIILLVNFLGKNQTEQAPVREQHDVAGDTVARAIVKPVKKDTAAATVLQPGKKEEMAVRESVSMADQKATGLINPAGGAKISRKEMILFKWTQKSDTFTRLYVYSETTNKLMLWRGITPGLQEYKIQGSYLRSGRFYWYVGKKEEKHLFEVIE